MERTEADRITAVESMYRIRAVESPPDANGRRTIWHRGAKGAELVSEVDEEGRVVRHELTLFDDSLSWDRENGFRGARVVKDGGNAAMPPSATLETPPANDLTAPVLERATGALRGYRGEDKIIAHLREVLVRAAKGRGMFADLGEVTRSAGEVRKALPPEPTPPPPARPGPVVVALVLGGLVLTIVGLALLLTR